MYASVGYLFIYFLPIVRGRLKVFAATHLTFHEYLVFFCLRDGFLEIERLADLLLKDPPGVVELLRVLEELAVAENLVSVFYMIVCLTYNSLQYRKLIKLCYFQRKHKEKHIFPLVIETFLLYLQRISIKPIYRNDYRT